MAALAKSTLLPGLLLIMLAEVGAHMNLQLEHLQQVDLVEAVPGL
jgi:hypothetical protein